MKKFLKLVFIWGAWGLLAYVVWRDTGSFTALIGVSGIGIIFAFLSAIDILRKDTSG